MSIVLAGHETTASELAWAFQLLAHNPRVLEKLIEEIDNGAGEEYLTATIKEVLRHRPVFLFSIPRAVKQPIEIGGWTYCPPTQLLGCIYLVHHDPGSIPSRRSSGPSASWRPRRARTRGCHGEEVASGVRAYIWRCSR